MSKKILYICPSSGLGGAETFLKTTFLKHQKESHSPVYLLFQKGPLYNWLNEKGATIEILPQRPRLSQPWTFLKTHIFIKKTIEKHSIDLVHSTMAYGALYTALACWQKKTKHLWFQHGPASGWMDQLAAALPHQCLIVNSEFTLQKQLQLEKPVSLFISPGRRIEKLHLGVEPVSFSENLSSDFRNLLLKKHQLNPDTLLIAMACRLQKWKGLDLIVDAASHIKNKNFFIFVWGDVFDSDLYVQQLKSRAKGLPISFEGPTENVPLAFSACDIVLNSSLQPEPFGLTLIEGLSVGKALLAPNEGGPQEILTEMKTGRFTLPRSSEDLSEKIKWFIENPSQLTIFKKNSLESFQNSFTSQKMMTRLEEIYDQLVL